MKIERVYRPYLTACVADAGRATTVVQVTFYQTTGHDGLIVVMRLVWHPKHTTAWVFNCSLAT
jgi:hypothetical protein